MAKAKNKGSVPANDPDVQAIRQAVVGDRSDDTIILIIPSHDNSRPQKKLTDQDQWADAALKLFGLLYRGATAFTALKGIWREDDGNELFDEPILIQSLAKREDAENEEKLEMLAEFARRLCRETNQDCVAVICNDTIHFIRAK